MLLHYMGHDQLCLYDGERALYCNGALDANEFVSDGTNTYYCQYDGNLLRGTATFDQGGTPIYMQANGEAAY